MHCRCNSLNVSVLTARESKFAFEATSSAVARTDRDAVRVPVLKCVDCDTEHNPHLFTDDVDAVCVNAATLLVA